jgi:hypothetical protein
MTRISRIINSVKQANDQGFSATVRFDERFLGFDDGHMRCDAILEIQRLFPQIYLACHVDHVRAASTPWDLSSHDASILAHLDRENAIKSSRTRRASQCGSFHTFRRYSTAQPPRLLDQRTVAFGQTAAGTASDAAWRESDRIHISAG